MPEAVRSFRVFTTIISLAAARSSVACGPPRVRDREALARALACAREAGGWIRGVGYHESVAGELDRALLDRLAPDLPVRIQHRSGALWILNSAALEHLGLDRELPRPGIERDAAGRLTGRLRYLDGWLRERLDGDGPPGLAEVSRSLAACGVTGVTDATPGNGAAESQALEAAIERGDLVQRLVVMGAPGLPAPGHPRMARGAVKLMLREHQLPSPEALEQPIRSAHAQGRPVAVHCVTRTELVLACAAFRAAGAQPGDRVEHAAVAPPDVLALLSGLPVTVVTQPGFVRERGDAYLVEVEPADRPWLYRGRGFLEAGVPLGGGTDAPFGDPDPWRAIRSAFERRTEGGRSLGPAEALTPEEALGLFLSSPSDPGGPARRVEPGAAADLCLLDRPWPEARGLLSSSMVRATLRGGSILYARDGSVGEAGRSATSTTAASANSPRKTSNASE